MPSDKPYWILRHHSPSSVQHVQYHSNPNLLIAGDSTGRISITHLQEYRQRCFWKAHKDSILGVQLLEGLAITHGRDNKICLWSLPSSQEGQGALTSSHLPSRLISALPVPTLVKEVDVNALNFCRFSLLLESGHGEQLDVLIAVPHTLDAAYFDILHLPSGKRLHQAISKPDLVSQPGSRQPIIMSLRLFKLQGRLSCLAGYEDGFVRLWQKDDSAESWSLSWERQLHSESVMDVALSSDLSFGISVSADDRISRFSITDQGTDPVIVDTQRPGKASVSIRQDGQVVAVAGWDGSIRMYAGHDLAHLGSLRYHRDIIETISFFDVQVADSESDDVDSAQSQRAASGLVAGGRDGKISLWKVF